MLRAAKLAENTKQYNVASGVFVTPLAREYLRDRGIELINGAKGAGMPATPIEERGGQTYVDAATGAGYAAKPERMTHLRGNLLVPKTHPRIAFRGKLDTLQGEIILAQTEACAEGQSALLADLGEVLDLTRQLMGAEVTGRDIEPVHLLGYNACELRLVSHQIQEHFGMAHPVPHYSMGRLAARLNLLRAQARETELAAERAFAATERDDILLALNRLSSAIYILLCRLLAGQYGR